MENEKIFTGIIETDSTESSYTKEKIIPDEEFSQFDQSKPQIEHWKIDIINTTNEKNDKSNSKK